MVFGQWRIVHFQCDERIGAGCLLDRNAAKKCGTGVIQVLRTSIGISRSRKRAERTIMPSLPGTWTGLSCAQSERGKTSTAATTPDTCFRKLRRESIESSLPDLTSDDTGLESVFSDIRNQTVVEAQIVAPSRHTKQKAVAPLGETVPQTLRKNKLDRTGTGSTTVPAVLPW